MGEGFYHPPLMDNQYKNISQVLSSSLLLPCLLLFLPFFTLFTHTLHFCSKGPASALRCVRAIQDVQIPIIHLQGQETSSHAL